VSDNLKAEVAKDLLTGAGFTTGAIAANRFLRVRSRPELASRYVRKVTSKSVGPVGAAVLGAMVLNKLVNKSNGPTVVRYS
jgi:hypothetical protein